MEESVDWQRSSFLDLNKPSTLQNTQHGPEWGKHLEGKLADNICVAIFVCPSLGMLLLDY